MKNVLMNLHNMLALSGIVLIPWVIPPLLKLRPPSYNVHSSTGCTRTRNAWNTLTNQLVQGDAKLLDYTSNSFTNHMNQIFSNSEVFSNGHMKKLNARHAARAANPEGKTDQSKDDSKNANLHINMSGDFGLISLSGGNAKVTIFDVANMLKMTNCLACRYPKNDACNHHMHKCPLLEEFGLTVTYDPEKDQHQEKVSNRFKQLAQEKQGKAAKAAATTTTTTTTNQTQVAESFKTVGKNGKETTTTTEKTLAEKKNLRPIFEGYTPPKKRTPFSCPVNGTIAWKLLRNLYMCPLSTVVSCHSLAMGAAERAVHL
jgi:hypothetical protein